MLQRFSSYSVDQPKSRQLLAVAVASGLPFVGFGFVDNAIMVRIFVKQFASVCCDIDMPFMLMLAASLQLFFIRVK